MAAVWKEQTRTRAELLLRAIQDSFLTAFWIIGITSKVSFGQPERFPHNDDGLCQTRRIIPRSGQTAFAVVLRTLRK